MRLICSIYNFSSIYILLIVFYFISENFECLSDLAENEAATEEDIEVLVFDYNELVINRSFSRLGQQEEEQNSSSAVAGGSPSPGTSSKNKRSTPVKVIPFDFSDFEL